jgi:ketosteroid isomerase-like protein
LCRGTRRSLVEVAWTLDPPPGRARYWRAMSQGNVEIIARLYENFLARPERFMSPEIVEFFDPAVELRQSASILGTEGTFHGYDGLLQSAREIIESFQDVRFVPRGIADAGDQVVATVEFRATGKESGVEVRQTVGHVWALRGATRPVTQEAGGQPVRRVHDDPVGLQERGAGGVGDHAGERHRVVVGPEPPGRPRGRPLPEQE